MNQAIVLVRGLCSAVLLLAVVGCSTVKYSTLEKLGIHKRDILVGNVEDARDAQEDAQEQFKDALQRFGEVVNIEDTELKRAYEQLNSEYKDSVDAAEEVRTEIEAVERVAMDLFAEWREEIKLYTDDNLKRDSQTKLLATQTRYNNLKQSMHAAERTMEPVLATMLNNVLYLKHNLNAQAIGAIQSSYSGLATDVDLLIDQMNESIERSNQFIENMQAG